MLTGPRTPKVAVAVAVALLLAGCGSDGGDDGTKTKPKAPPAAKESPRPGDQRVTITWKGKKRVYAVHAPPTYTPAKKLPLVIAMHPYPSDGAYAAKLTGLNAKADKEGFLVAYPDGLNQAYNALICCGAEDDVGFISTMTKRLLTTWQADPDRVYATGINIMEIGIGTWHERLACKAGPAVKVKDNNTRTPAKCRDQSEFLTYRLPDMGHNWPGSKDPGMGDPVTGVNATDLIWESFKAHPRKSS
jgi:poly(3-hydroxybutyrate) depolymerase